MEPGRIPPHLEVRLVGHRGRVAVVLLLEPRREGRPAPHHPAKAPHVSPGFCLQRVEVWTSTSDGRDFQSVRRMRRNN